MIDGLLNVIKFAQLVILDYLILSIWFYQSDLILSFILNLF